MPDGPGTGYDRVGGAGDGAGAENHGVGEIAILFNGNESRVPRGETVAHLLERLDIATAGCALALNSEVLSRAQWPVTVIVEGDEIEVLTAAAGG